MPFVSQDNTLLLSHIINERMCSPHFPELTIALKVSVFPSRQAVELSLRRPVTLYTAFRAKSLRPFTQELVAEKTLPTVFAASLFCNWRRS